MIGCFNKINRQNSLVIYNSNNELTNIYTLHFINSFKLKIGTKTKRGARTIGTTMVWNILVLGLQFQETE